MPLNKKTGKFEPCPACITKAAEIKRLEVEVKAMRLTYDPDGWVMQIREQKQEIKRLTEELSVANELIKAHFIIPMIERTDT